MNKNQYSLVFSKKFGVLVPVAETVASQGKGTGESACIATPALVASAQSRTAKFFGSAITAGLGSFSFAVAASLVGAGAFSSSVWAQCLPTGGSIVSGAGTGVIGTSGVSGSTLTIGQSSKVLSTNWNSFSVGAGCSVNINQAMGSQSIFIGRVTGNNRSDIFGNLQANGQVFLINPNGIMMGASGQIQISALAASTKEMTDAAIASGNANGVYKFTNTAGLPLAGGITLQSGASIRAFGWGTAAAANGGYVVLHADRITNSGTIEAGAGRITLAAGQSLGLTLSNGQLVSVQVTGDVINALVQNKGLLVADGGQVYLTAKGKDSLLQTVVNNEGVIRARSLGNKNGIIHLDANDGDVTHSGAVDVSGADKGDLGGVAVFQGNRVALLSTAIVDASGVAGGGRVVVGGDALGKVTDITQVRFANHTVIQQGASINIGSANGNGGFVETSGTRLEMAGTVNGTAKGKNGLWLIDPSDLSITSNVALVANMTQTGGVFNTTSTSAQVLNSTINAALDANTDVILVTTSSSGQQGSITQQSNAHLQKSTAGTATLTYQANQTINLFANITAINGGKLNVNFSAANSVSGGVNFNNVNITTGGGNITAYGCVTSSGAAGIAIIDSKLNAEGGSINLTGSSSTGQGIRFQSGLSDSNLATFGAGSITLTGSSASQKGVNFLSGTQTIRSNNTLISGTSGGSNAGVIFEGTSTQTIDGVTNISGQSSSGSAISASSGTRNFNGTTNVSGTTTSGTQAAISIGSTGTINAAGNTTFSGLHTGNGFGFQQSATSTFNAGGNTTVLGTSTGGGTGVLLAGAMFDSTNSITTTISGNSTGNHGVILSSGTRNFGGNTSVIGYSSSNVGPGIRISGAGTTNTAGNTTFRGTGSNSNQAGFLFSAGTLNLGGNNTIVGTADVNSGVILNQAAFSLASNASLTIVGSSASNPTGVLLPTASNFNTSGNISITGLSALGTGLDMSLIGNISAANIYLNSSSSINVTASQNLTATQSLSILSFGDVNISTSVQAGTNITIAAGLGIAAGNVSGGAVVKGAGGALLANTAGMGGTVNIYSGTPNAASNTSVFQSLVAGATNATTSKTYNTAALNGSSNVSSKLNVFYRVAPTFTVVAGVQSKVYDGNLTVTNTSSYSGSGGLLEGDSLSGINLSYADKNAAIGSKVVVASEAVFNNGLTKGYVVTYTNNTASTIERANLTVTASTQSKVYDGGFGVSNNSLYSVTGNVSGESISDATLAYTNRNAGAANKTISASNAVAGANTSLSNYNISYVNNTVSSISKLNLTITADIYSKTYDGNTNLTGGSYSTVNGYLIAQGDTLTNITQAYSDKNAGTNKTTAVTGYTLSDGNGGNNYNITLESSTGNVINKKDLTVVANAQSKVYDGGLGVTNNSLFAVTGNVSGESISSATLAYTDKNAGAGTKTIAVSGATAGANTSLANYNVMYSNSTASSIIAANLTVAASTQTKVYDGGLAVSNVSSFTTAGLVLGESVSAATLAYTDKNAGAGTKTIAVSGATAGANTSLANYNVMYSNSTASSITAANLTVAASTQTKVYDGGLAVANVSSFTTAGLVLGESVSAATLAYTDKNAGAGTKTIAVSGATAGANTSLANYVIAYVSNTTSTIDKKVVNVSGITVNNKPADGTNLATANTTNASFATLVAADVGSVNVLVGNATFANGSPGTQVATLSNLTLSGTAGGNYELGTGSQTTASANISMTSSDPLINAIIIATGNGTAPSGDTVEQKIAQLSHFFAGQHVSPVRTDRANIASQGTAQAQADEEQIIGQAILNAPKGFVNAQVNAFVPVSTSQDNRSWLTIIDADLPYSRK